jgi:hypothetical protein
MDQLISVPPRDVVQATKRNQQLMLACIRSDFELKKAFASDHKRTILRTTVFRKSKQFVQFEVVPDGLR